MTWMCRCVCVLYVADSIVCGSYFNEVAVVREG